MGISRTVSETDGEFSRKSQIFPIPLTGSPWNWVSAQESVKTGMMALTDGGKVLR